MTARPTRAYLEGERTAVVRKRTVPNPFEPYVEYCRARLSEDPHLWATTLYDEVVDLGYAGGYQIFTRQLRTRELRPVCQECRPARARPVAVIEHPPGEETQWDWVELPDPPKAWCWGARAHLLVGVLAHSGRWRGLLLESEDQAHLIAGIDHIVRDLGGVTKAWRFDRMATVCHPPTGKVTATFAAVAKHYGVSVAICPPRRGDHKGVVEKAVHVAAQPSGSGAPCRTRPPSTRPMPGSTSGAPPVGTPACAPPRTPSSRSPPPRHVNRSGRCRPRRSPPSSTVQRKVSAQALVAYRGNSYSVPPQLTGTAVTVLARLGDPHLDIATPGGVVVARHRPPRPGPGPWSAITATSPP